MKHFVRSPLSSSVETSRTATQVASVSIGAAVDTRVCACGAFVHVLAATAALLKVKARRTHTLEAAQCVVAGGRATHCSCLTLVFICREEDKYRETISVGLNIFSVIILTEKVYISFSIRMNRVLYIELELKSDEIG